MMSSEVRTHYDNLQVTRTASDEVIRGAYRYLCQKWHPDKHPGDREKAERITKLVNEAYRVLSDPALRREHDEWIAAQEAAAGSNANQRARSDTDAPGSSSEGTQGVDAADREALAMHAHYAARGPLKRLWFMVLLVAAAFLLLRIIATTPRALHDASGVIATICALFVLFTVIIFLAALCIYCYAKLFPPDPRAPEWTLDLLMPLGTSSASDWFKAALGVLVWCGIFGMLGQHFDSPAASETSATNTMTPSDAPSGQAQVAETAAPAAPPAQPATLILHDETTFVARDDAYIYRFKVDGPVRVRLSVAVDGDAPVDVFTVPENVSKDEYLRISLNLQTADAMKGMEAGLSVLFGDAPGQEKNPADDMSALADALFNSGLSKRGLYRNFEGDWQSLTPGIYSLVIDNTDAFTPVRGDAPVRVRLLYQQM